MEIRKLRIGKNTWELINETWENSRAWGHKTNVLKNGVEYASHRCRYYNRTWEMYTYQSCMFGAIAEIKNEKLASFIDNYKQENNITRFKKGEKENVTKMFEKTEIGKELKKLHDAIELRKFD